MKNKLVRDKIPEIIKSRGGNPQIHKADDKEYWQSLKTKLQEEVDEFLESEEVEELTDILEVIRTIGAFKNINMEKLEKLRQRKASRRGKFTKRLILESSR